MAILIGVSPFLAGYITYMYLYVNMSGFDNTTNCLPWTNAACVCMPSNPSNDQKRQLECVLQVIRSTQMMRYGPFELSLVCHKGGCCGKDVMSTEAVNGNSDNWFMLSIVDRSSEVHGGILLNIWTMVPDSRNHNESEGHLNVLVSVHLWLHISYLHTSVQIWANLTMPLTLHHRWRWTEADGIHMLPKPSNSQKMRRTRRMIINTDLPLVIHQEFYFCP